MVSDLKKIYEEKASLISDYKHINKNELVNLYIKNENNPILKEAYLSAIICRYWELINKYYQQSYTSVSIEECYDWLIRAILYALEHRKWLDPENKLYNDPCAPDKVINRCMLSSRRIFYQASNYAKRTLNYKTTSVEDVMLAYGDVFPDEDNSFNEVEDCTNSLINEAISNDNYFLAFMIDGIAYFDTFKTYDYNDNIKHFDFCERKLAKHLKNLDKNYGDMFSQRFKVDKNNVYKAIEEYNKLSRVKLYNRIHSNMERLRKNKKLLEVIE